MIVVVVVVVVIVACIFAFVFFPRGSKGAEQIDTALYSLSILGNKFVPLLKLLEKIRATFLAIGQCRMQAEVQIFQAT